MVRLISLVMAWLMCASVITPAHGQNIGDFDKISRVGGFRNFILNPSAQFHTLGVTTSNATATRSTTTPVGEGGTEWNVAITTANGYVDFSNSGATTANLGGAKCEASMRARGFQTSSLFQVLDGSSVLYSVVIGVLVTAQYVVIDFPCPANPSGLKTRITDTAILTGINEVGDSYLGRSRNIGDAATITECKIFTPVVTNLGTGSTAFASGCWRRVGDYAHIFIRWVKDASAGSGASLVTVSAPPELSGLRDSTKQPGAEVGYISVPSGGTTQPIQYGVAATGTGTTGFLIRTSGSALNGASIPANTEWDYYISYPITGWTASSIISPSQQNAYGVRKWDGNQGSPSRNTNAYLGFSDATLASNVTNIGSATACASSSNLCIKIPSLPAGEYRADITATMVADAGTICTFGLSTTNSSTGVFSTFEVQGDATTNLGWSSHAHGYFTVTSQADTEIYLLGNRISGNVCVVSGGSSSRRITMSVTPANRSPTSVYVRSPMKANLTAVAPAADDVGGRLVASRGSAFTLSTTLSTYTDIDSLALTVGPGVFDLYTVCPLFHSWTSGVGYANSAIAIRVGSTLVALGTGGFSGDSTARAPGVSLVHASAKARVNPSVATTYKTSATILGYSGSPVFGSFIAQANYGDCYIESVRAPDL